MSSPTSRVTELIRLGGKGWLALVPGTAFGILTAVQAVKDSPGTSPWLWATLSAVSLLFVAVKIAWSALAERDQALRSTSRGMTAVHWGEGAGSGGSNISISGIRMQAGPAEAARSPKRRRWARILTDYELDELANRCEATSREITDFLHRPEPSFADASEEAWEESRRKHDEHRQETARIFHGRFAPAARDLLNECAEAGYYLPEDLERFRIEGDAHWHDMQMVGEGLGVVALRLRRRSKKLEKGG